MYHVLFFNEQEKLVYHLETDDLTELATEMTIHFNPKGHIEIWES